MRGRRRSLDALLSDRVTSLKREVAKTQLGPLADDLEPVKALAELAELERASREARSRLPLRFVIIALFLACGIFAAWLVTGYSETDIDLESRITSLSFTLEAPQQLLQGIKLSRLTVANVTCISQSIAVVEDCPSRNHVAQVVFDTERRSDRRTVLNVSSLNVPAGSRVTIEKPLNASSYQLSIASATPPALAVAARKTALSSVTPPPLVVAARGTVVRITGGTNTLPPDPENRAPQLTRLRAGPPLMITVVPRAGTRVEFGKLVAVSHLALMDEQHNADEHAPLVLPSVLSGSVYLGALDGKRIALRRYDRLRFETSTGEIRSLSPDETGEGTALLLRYHGKVQGMTRGPGTMP